jgi:hypothetical protein
MAIRTISHDAESLLAVREELIYTKARMVKNEHAKDLVAPVADLLARWATVNQGQLTRWDAEIEAQAGVDEVDDGLDDVVNALDAELLHLEGQDRSTVRYRRYMSTPRTQIVRLGLASEVEKTRAWPAALATEPEQTLKDIGAKIATAVSLGDSALEERTLSGGATATHRARDIATFIDDVNGARRSIFGILTDRAAKLGLPKDWPDRFFRHRTTERKQTVPVTPPTP